MKTWLRQNRGFLLFVVGFAFFRSAMADWNTIPSGSMRPTLLEGDVVLVDFFFHERAAVFGSLT